MIREQHGDLLKARADALVNTVNTVGVMGKGVALQFKRAFPANYKAYRSAGDREELQLGRMFVWDAGALAGGTPRFVINFPTKGHWRSKSRLADIEAGLHDLVRVIRERDISSVAVPPLGCGNGGLAWVDVRPVIERAFAQVPDVTVLLFPPEGAPPASEQVVRTERPKMTPGRAVVVGMMAHYLPFAVEVTAVDIQKQLYLLQEAGEPLRLNYVKGRYGPYADNLRHVLAAMERHFIQGTGDGSAGALDTLPFELLPGAVDEADQVLDHQPATRERFERVVALIEGFESTYGLELLATTHWAATRDEDGLRQRKPADLVAVEQVVQSWNERKGRLFTSPHIKVAYERLQSLGWLGPTDEHELPLGA